MSTEQIIVNDVAIQTSVPPIEVQPVEVAVKQTKEKKPKKVSDSPKLAPKFQKYLYFGYWVALQLKNKNLINDEVFQTILTDIKMNDEVGVQNDFYANYENVEFKMVSRKPTVSPDAPSLAADGVVEGQEVKPKAKKARKVGKPKVAVVPEGEVSEAVPVEGVEGVAEVKPKAAKKARKPKVAVVPEGEVSEAVPVEGVEGVAEVKPKASKKARKPKVAVVPEGEVAVEGVPVEGEEVKPKAKKSRKVGKPTVSPTTPSLPEGGVSDAVPVEGLVVEDKSKPVKKNGKSKTSGTSANSNDIIHDLLVQASSSETVEAQNEKPTVEIQNNNDDNDSEDEDVSVSTIIINNEEYLIDDQFNLYHIITHDNIGTFINEQLKLRTSYEFTSGK